MGEINHFPTGNLNVKFILFYYNWLRLIHVNITQLGSLNFREQINALKKANIISEEPQETIGKKRWEQLYDIVILSELKDRQK